MLMHLGKPRGIVDYFPHKCKQSLSISVSRATSVPLVAVPKADSCILPIAGHIIKIILGKRYRLVSI